MFILYTVNNQSQMPLDKVFFERKVNPPESIASTRPVQRREESSNQRSHAKELPAQSAYREVAEIPVAPEVLRAGAVMTSPVITVTSDTAVGEVLEQFLAGDIRHMPVVSPDGRLVGIVSERDILRHLAGINATYKTSSKNTRVETVMIPEVLTADIDTDVRYVARLFVEQRVGALPIIKDGQLQGIITRSDVLRAVMHNFSLELWA